MEEPEPNKTFGTDIHRHTIEFSKNTRTEDPAGNSDLLLRQLFQPNRTKPRSQAPDQDQLRMSPGAPRPTSFPWPLGPGSVSVSL